MIKGNFVIDGVTHAFDGRLSNMKWKHAESTYESYFRGHWDLSPEKYRLTRPEFFSAMTAEALASALFVESDTDVAFYHAVPMWGVFGDLSPLSVGAAIRDRYPGRMFLYGGVSPLEGAKALDDLARQVEEFHISALKLYPYDIIRGEIVPMRMNDERVAYPVFEKCRQLGIKVIAVHKAVPDVTTPVDIFRSNDVDYAARDFPDLNFVIVHAGLAFLDETKFALGAFSNIYVNLEITSQLVVRHPRLFAQILGELTLWGSNKQILWGTGAAFFHPQPSLDAFANFEMPADMVETCGYAPLTDDIKADILGRNFARAHGLDIDRLKAAIADDELDKLRKRGLAQPWASLRVGADRGSLSGSTVRG